MKWLSLFLLIGLFPGWSLAQEGPAKPNVVWIICDDLNKSLSCYGHPLVKTPNLDKLAATGMRFDRAICPFPLCNPSRTCILSGCRPDTTGIVTNNDNPRMKLKEAIFLPQFFKQQGYFVAAAGKVFHGGMNDPKCWDIYHETSSHDFAADALDRPRPKGNDSVLPKPTRNRDDQEPDGRIAQKIVEWLEAKREKPFFLAAGFHSPHAPHVAPKKYFDLYPLDRISLPVTPKDDGKDWPSVLKVREVPNYKDWNEDKAKRSIAGYYSCLSFLDAQVGTILDALDRLQLRQHTIVVFMSDHGYHLGEHKGPVAEDGLWAKGSLFIECACSPLIVSVPGKKPGVCTKPVEYVALYPTLADLCGLPKPTNIEGTSFARLIDDPTKPWLPCAFHYAKGGTSVWTERYRYTEYRNNEKYAALYDHQTDPHEFKNLVSDAKYADILKELRGRMKTGWKPIQEGK